MFFWSSDTKTTDLMKSTSKQIKSFETDNQSKTLWNIINELKGTAKGKNDNLKLQVGIENIADKSCTDNLKQHRQFSTNIQLNNKTIYFTPVTDDEVVKVNQEMTNRHNGFDEVF